MKQIFMMMAALSLYSVAAYAADVTPGEVMSAETAHMLQVQAEQEAMQRASDDAFLKDLEAQMLLEEQQFLAQEAATQASVQP